MASTSRPQSSSASWRAVSTRCRCRAKLHAKREDSFAGAMNSEVGQSSRAARSEQFAAQPGQRRATAADSGGPWRFARRAAAPLHAAFLVLSRCLLGRRRSGLRSSQSSTVLQRATGFYASCGAPALPHGAECRRSRALRAAAVACRLRFTGSLRPRTSKTPRTLCRKILALLPRVQGEPKP